MLVAPGHRRVLQVNPPAAFLFLRSMTLQAARFQDSVLTLFCGVVGDPDLLQAQQDVMRKGRKGPHLSRLAIAGYLEAEKLQGRVSAELDSEMVAGLLLRASFGRVFEDRFAGTASAAASTRQTKMLIAALIVLPRGRSQVVLETRQRKNLRTAGKVRA